VIRDDARRGRPAAAGGIFCHGEAVARRVNSGGSGIQVAVCMPEWALQQPARGRAACLFCPPVGRRWKAQAGCSTPPQKVQWTHTHAQVAWGAGGPPHPPAALSPVPLNVHLLRPTAHQTRGRALVLSYSAPRSPWLARPPGSRRETSPGPPALLQGQHAMVTLAKCRAEAHASACAPQSRHGAVVVARRSV